MNSPISKDEPLKPFEPDPPASESATSDLIAEIKSDLKKLQGIIHYKQVTIEAQRVRIGRQAKLLSHYKQTIGELEENRALIPPEVWEADRVTMMDRQRDVIERLECTVARQRGDITTLVDILEGRKEDNDDGS